MKRDVIDAVNAMATLGISVGHDGRIISPGNFFGSMPSQGWRRPTLEAYRDGWKEEAGAISHWETT